MQPPLLRAVTAADLAGVFAIYNDVIAHSTATLDTEPRGPEAQQLWLAEHASPRHPACVAVDTAGEITGFGSLSPWSARGGYHRTVEDSLYLAAGARGAGLGREVLDWLLQRAAGAGHRVVLARMTDDNVPSIRLHASKGFRTVGILRGVGEKFGRILDVRIMERQLGGTG